VSDQIKLRGGEEIFESVAAHRVGRSEYAKIQVRRRGTVKDQVQVIEKLVPLLVCVTPNKPKIGMT
jgi:hypothetical protein